MDLGRSRTFALIPISPRKIQSSGYDHLAPQCRQCEPSSSCSLYAVFSDPQFGHLQTFFTLAPITSFSHASISAWVSSGWDSKSLRSAIEISPMRFNEPGRESNSRHYPLGPRKSVPARSIVSRSLSTTWPDRTFRKCKSSDCTTRMLTVRC